MGAVLGIHHICVNAPDLEKSLRFYRDTLGFAVLSRESCEFGEYAMLGLGNSRLELIMPNARNADSFGNRGSIAHFGLLVQDIDAVFTALKQKGVRFLSDRVIDYTEPMGGFRAVSLLGPSDEAINLYEFDHAI